MIYTVTFNPAIDYVIHLEDIELGAVNRTESEEIFFGGKGINVSTVLSNLGAENIALGFISGFTGKAIESGLNKNGIKTDFIELESGITRINVKIKSKEETDINGQGPAISRKAITELLDKLKILQRGDFLVLAGSIPSTMPDDIYEKIMERLKDSGSNIVVDATGDLLKNVLKYHPFLVKPNNHELGEMFGVEINTEEEIIEYAGKLRQMGARNVLVSRAGDGAILTAENGEVIKMGVPSGKVLNSVGAGDSMVAGFIFGYLQSGDYREALKLGTACGSATAFSPGLAEKEKVEELIKIL